ncbi:hypothetical protein Amsp01_042660 [Amycolatopsis sp. NBRC 101858]|uniref:hypothetical protein n=1 Tax=Amycolatopsis sp. NBRC 101858 TaxID=3032200 RepID=UPI0024A09469|nr:hypothetical protein [Amycolatopsis sp. NBRC 101858]GLY38242.1 hypothetical protein Amsp01_042660 [Amycolatopsis sp. NBRC 101858]
MEGVLNELEVSGGMTTDEADKADVARARLARLGGDAELYERLAGRGFAGVEYDFFRAELAAYALPVLRSFIRRKMIYSMCREVGRPVKPSDLVSDHLARYVDDRLELAGETIARGLQMFEQHALRGGKWTPQGGASLKTYFVGACVRSFSAAYKRWLAEYDHPDSVPLELAPEPCGVEDPEAAAVGLLTVEEHLDAMKPVARDLAARVALRAETFEEAGEAYGLSARAVEGHFYRHRAGTGSCRLDQALRVTREANSRGRTSVR